MAERTPVASQTGPDNVTEEVKDAARLELACVQMWVVDEGTRESIRETERFPQHSEAMTEPDVHGEEIDIRTVTVTLEDDGPDLGKALLDVELICPMWRRW